MLKSLEDLKSENEEIRKIVDVVALYVSYEYSSKVENALLKMYNIGFQDAKTEDLKEQKRRELELEDDLR